MENKANPIAILKLHLCMAFADKILTLEEIKFIDKICLKYKISEKEKIKNIKNIQKSNVNIYKIAKKCISEIADIKSQKECIKSLAILISADYVVYEDELLLYQLIANKWNMNIRKVNNEAN